MFSLIDASRSAYTDRSEMFILKQDSLSLLILTS